MTRLRKMMLEELQRRNYSDGTIRHHLRSVTEFAEHFGKPPDKLGSTSCAASKCTCSRNASCPTTTVDAIHVHAI